MAPLVKRVMTVFAVVAFCIGCDQGTKRFADLYFKNQPPRTYLKNTVQLLYAENTGAWGSLGESWPAPFKNLALVAFPVFILAVVVFQLLKRRDVARMELIAYSLILGGGLGNIIDRIAYGYVIDFMYVGFGRLATNIFNVADMAIVTGIGMLLLGSWRSRQAARSPELKTSETRSQ